MSRSDTFIRDKMVMIIDQIGNPENYVLGDLGEFIRDLIMEGVDKEEIDKQMKTIEHISDYIPFILDYIWIYNDLQVESIQIFQVCCLLDFEATKTYYKCILSLDDVRYKVKTVYHPIFKLEKTKSELAKYKQKYKLLKEHIKYMPGGKGYEEVKEDFKKLLSK